MHTYPGTKYLVFSFLLFLCGAFIRLDYLLADGVRLDADEAIVGLMADDILEGGELPVFYYGQHYMGSLEALSASLIFWISGESSNLTLRLAPFFYSLLLMLVLQRLAREWLGTRAGLIALALVAFAPPALILWSSKARGGFIEVIFLGALALLFARRWMSSEVLSLPRALLVGLCVGIGWWVNNQIIYFLAPLGVLLLLRSFFGGINLANFVLFLKHCAAATIGFFVGGLPFWIYNFQNDFPSFGLFGFASLEDSLEHLSGFFTVSLPILLGSAKYWDTAEIFPGAIFLALGFTALLLFAFCLSSRTSLVNLLRLRIGPEDFASVLLVQLLAIPLIFAASQFGYLSEAPRYLLPMYVPLILALAAALSVLGAKLATVLLSISLVFNVFALYGNGRSIPGEPFVYAGERVRKDHSELYDWLYENGVDFIRTNYWIGYRVAFETKERVRFHVFGEPSQVRISSYEDEFNQRTPNSIPYVLVPTQASLFREALPLQGVTFSETVRSGYNIFHNLEKPQRQFAPIPMGTVMVSSSHGEEFTALLRDDDLKTRWRTASPQEDGMWLRFTFPSEVSLGKLTLQYGEWIHDVPKKLEVRAVIDSEEQILLSRRQYRAIQYYAGNRSEIDFYFPTGTKVRELTLRQVGSHPILDWSLAEVDFFSRSSSVSNEPIEAG